MPADTLVGRRSGWGNALRFSSATLSLSLTARADCEVRADLLVDLPLDRLIFLAILSWRHDVMLRPEYVAATPAPPAHGNQDNAPPDPLKDVHKHVSG